MTEPGIYIYIPGSSKCVKFVPVHLKKLPDVYLRTPEPPIFLEMPTHFEDGFFHPNKSNHL